MLTHSAPRERSSRSWRWIDTASEVVCSVGVSRAGGPKPSVPM